MPVVNVVAPVVVTVPPRTADPEETSSVDALIAWVLSVVPVVNVVAPGVVTVPPIVAEAELLRIRESA